VEYHKNFKFLGDKHLRPPSFGYNLSMGREHQRGALSVPTDVYHLVAQLDFDVISLFLPKFLNDPCTPFLLCKEFICGRSFVGALEQPSIIIKYFDRPAIGKEIPHGLLGIIFLDRKHYVQEKVKSHRSDTLSHGEWEKLWLILVAKEAPVEDEDILTIVREANFVVYLSAHSSKLESRRHDIKIFVIFAAQNYHRACGHAFPQRIVTDRNVVGPCYKGPDHTSNLSRQTEERGFRVLVDTAL
jgi:hypothetical protein